MSRVGTVIYKRCVAGDRRKVEADSQDAATGGGARDIRFNPLETFEPVLKKVFDGRRTTPRGRPVNYASVYWWEDGAMRGPVEIEIMGPYESRKRTEMRLTRVHEVTPFDKDHIPAPELDPFFFIWADEARVWARYVTRQQLGLAGWPSCLVNPILESVARVSAGKNIRGWRDLITGEGQHHDG